MTIRRILISLILLLSTAPAAWSQGADPTGAPPRDFLTSDAIRRIVSPLVRGQLESRRMAGAVVVVVKDGAVLFSEGYGYADVTSRRAMGPETLVRIGSITKMLTALAVMQLVEAGKLDLDRDVNESLNLAIPSAGRRPVTLRRLLSHRTQFEDRRGGIGSVSGDRLPLGPFVARHLPPRLDQHDDVVAYSNVNATLAAYAVERASGQSFEAYLSDQVFQPARMTRATAVQPVPASLLPDVSNGYIRSDLPTTAVSMGAATIYEVGSTGVVASGADMGRLMLAILDPAAPLISRRSLDAMMTTQTPMARGVMGLGLYSPVASGGNAFIGHDGDTGSLHSAMALLPERRTGVFVSYNSDGLPMAVPPATELLQQIWAQFFADVRLSSPATPTTDVGGTYQPARRVNSNLFTLRGLFEQLAIRSAADGLTIRPAMLPVGVPLEQIAPGVFRWSGRDVSFMGSGPSAVMQIGSPVLQLVRIPWWESAGLVVPVTIVCLIIAALAVLVWPITLLRRHRHADAVIRRLRLATRLALLFDLMAFIAAFWLVFWGWPLVALSSSLVVPLALGIHTAAWTAVLLTPLAVWHVVRLTRQDAGFWACSRECLLAGVLVVLSTFCVYWRVAGTSLAF